MRSDSLLANRLYRRLFAARTISNLGNGIAPIALAFGVLGLPGATPTSLSVVLAAAAVPEVLIMPIGGVVADRLGRARVIAAGDIATGVLVAIIATTFLTGKASVPLLTVLSFCSGVLAALWYPAYSGLVPDVVAEEHIQPANAYISVASNGGLILGSAVGGILVATLGSGVAIAIDAATFLVAGALVATFRHVSLPFSSGLTVLGDLRSGWAVFWSFRWIVVIVGAFAFLVMALRGAEAVMGPVLAVQSYGGARGWSLVLAAESTGLLLGAFVGARIRVARPMLFGMAVMFTLPVWLVGLAFAVPLSLAAAGAFLWGASIEMFAVLWYTALHTNVPRESLSRVGAYDAMGSLMFGPIGLALAGPLVAAVGLRAGFLTAAAICVVAITASLLSRDVRDQGLVRADPAPAPGAVSDPG